MSKERELLKRCLDFMLDEGANLNPLFKEVNDELLGQPEQDLLQAQIESGFRAIKDKLNEEPIGEIALSGNTVGIGAPFLAVKWVTGMMPSIGTKLYTSPQNRNPEQEPIYIVGKGWQCDEMPEEGLKLYTLPPKLKPLSDDEIMQTTQGMSEFAADMFKAGIKAAERSRGIGGEE